MLLHDLLLPVVSRCFPSRQVAHRVPNSWCGSVASPCFALLPGPVSGPPGPRSVLRVRFFPIRCFPLLPVASRCLPGRRIIPRIPNPWCGSVASRSAASRCFPLYRHRPLRAVVPAKRNRDFSDVCRRCLATFTCQTMDTNEAHDKAHLCVTCGSGNPECIP